MKKNILFTIPLLLALSTLTTPMWAQSLADSSKLAIISSLNNPDPWANKTFRKLSKKQRIAQLFMVPVYSSDSKEKQDSILRLISKYGVGGIITFQGGPIRHANMLNRIQASVKVPVLVATDGEWGLGMRLDSTISYPFQMTLGAIQSDTLLYKMGLQMAGQFRRVGIHVNFAPVIDVNNNINNPVINFRSFGENKENVASKGIALMRGMQDGGLLATAKHFPGHGDTDVDSHLDMPVLKMSHERLDTLELYPFKKLINAGISSIMVAHMSIPALDSTANLPSSLSKPIITDLLRDKLHFKGIVFTDAMNMKGVVKYHPPGESEPTAIIAGTDMVEMSINVPLAIKNVKKAIRQGRISKKEVYAKCKKILAAKKMAGLDHYQPIYLPNLVQDLNLQDAKDLIQQMADASVTLLRNPDVTYDIDAKTAVISIGPKAETLFQQTIAAKKRTANFIVPKDASNKLLDSVRKALPKFDRIIVCIHNTQLRPYTAPNYNTNVIGFITELSASPKTFINLLANAYQITKLPGVENAKGLLVGYEDSPYTEQAAAQVMLNELVPKGKLPVTVNAQFKAGDGLQDFGMTSAH
ncbi:glycoside hydrolase family 3 protein [Solitalea koreensis]|uniref:beta-N-acetylhexosaminidase n=1 Tax=Solitalea koreensis TaxID=543615 RepID=A0A521AYL8_9SPHI|nr:glycoside hydrolase family 3 N-terminal domain-containing protein [Solitalea koreensis]SMO39851.1 beta-glucosidase [Solitalea koreensis]